MQDKDFYIKNGRLFGPYTSKEIPLREVRDAVEWIAWSADADGRFRSGEMRERLGIPQSHVATILGALSSIGAVGLVSRRMGYAVTDDDPDGWVGALTFAFDPTAVAGQNDAESPDSRPCAEFEPDPFDDAWCSSGFPNHETRLLDTIAAMKPDVNGRDVALRCRIDGADAYCILRQGDSHMEIVGLAKKSALNRNGKVWFEGNYDGHGIGFDDEGKLKHASSAKSHGLVFRGPYQPTAPDIHSRAESSAPRSSSTTVSVPFTASDRDLQRMVGICRKLNVNMTMY